MDRDIAWPSEKSASVTCLHVIGVVVLTGREVSRSRSVVLKLLGPYTDDSIMLFGGAATAGIETTFYFHRARDEVAYVLSGEFTF